MDRGRRASECESRASLATPPSLTQFGSNISDQYFRASLIFPGSRGLTVVGFAQRQRSKLTVVRIQCSSDATIVTRPELNGHVLLDWHGPHCAPQTREKGSRITQCVPADKNRAQDVRRQANLQVWRMQRPGRPQCVTLFFMRQTSSMGIAAKMPRTVCLNGGNDVARQYLRLLRKSRCGRYLS